MTRLNRFCFSKPVMTLYSWFLVSTIPLLKIAAVFSPRIRFQLAHRHLLGAPRPNANQPCYVVFCSSAGEYEQAKPVINRLTTKGYHPFIFFFSASGYNFAKKKGEQHPYALAPLDANFVWERLFKRLNPRFSIVVRHEIWPAFLTTAKRFGPTYLIDYARHDGTKGSALKQCLLMSFERVFGVGDDDLRSIGTQSLLTGDTKYDRVIERANEVQANDTALLAPYVGSNKVLIIGSAWPQDLACVLAALDLLSETRRGLRLVVVPHDLSKENLGLMQTLCDEAGFRVVRLSQTNSPSALEERQVLLVDALGKLAELYREAQYCFVGGAMHHRVHNALEPAVYNLAIAFGPHYHTQKEAVLMAEHGLATICKDANDVADWLSKLLGTSSAPLTRAFVDAHAGASTKIVDTIVKDLGG